MTQFKNLPKFTPRKYYTELNPILKENEIRPILEELIHKPITSHQDFDEWIGQISELFSIIDEISSILYIQMTCDTEDTAKSDAYQNYIEEIAPLLKKNENLIQKKILDLSQQYESKQFNLERYLHTIETDLKIYSDENLTLSTQIELLSHEYQTLMGSMTVIDQGVEKTLTQMTPYLLETDRQTRYEAWRKISTRRLQDQEKIETLFNQMLTHRNQIATNVGLNFIEYQYQNFHRDYTPKDCSVIRETIHTLVKPLVIKILNQRKKNLQVDTLKPWDLSVNFQLKSPLKPFSNIDGLIDAATQIFTSLDPDFHHYFNILKKNQLLDLPNRKGKAPGGYQSTLNESRLPFIFMNAVGLDTDLRTLLHESGHAFHALLSQKVEPIFVRHAPMEFCEIASMSMELIAGEHLDPIYNSEEYKRSKSDHLESIIMIMPWIILVDDFQHWIYSNPKHTNKQRANIWCELYHKYYYSMIDWDTYEPELSSLWHKQLHIFEYPFYYIEYCIAQIGALHFWKKYLESPHEAIQTYKHSMQFGGSLNLVDLFHEAKIPFDFTIETLKPLFSLVEQNLNQCLDIS